MKPGGRHAASGPLTRAHGPRGSAPAIACGVWAGPAWPSSGLVGRCYEFLVQVEADPLPYLEAGLAILAGGGIEDQVLGRLHAGLTRFLRVT